MTKERDMYGRVAQLADELNITIEEAAHMVGEVLEKNKNKTVHEFYLECMLREEIEKTLKTKNVPANAKVMVSDAELAEDKGTSSTTLCTIPELRLKKGAMVLPSQFNKPNLEPASHIRH